jgi:hypothetical protein
MTNPSEPESGQHRNGAGKSLKEQNRWQIWIIVAVNSLFLYGVVQANAVRTDGLRDALTGMQNLVPVGLALAIATVLNGLVSPDMKARLVFLRWHHPLPGHRAFSRYALLDPRIDTSALEKLYGGLLPAGPVEQNRAWYRIYKTVENDPAVRQVHRDFLLLRDYTALSAVFTVFYGVAGLYAIPSTRTAIIYLLVLAAQSLIARQAASNYGVRMVTTVLARRAAKVEIRDRNPHRRKRVAAQSRKTPS